MRMRYIAVVATIILCASAIFLLRKNRSNPIADTIKNEKHDGYDGPLERGYFEYLRTKDPATNTVPIERLWNAMIETEEVKSSSAAMRSNNFTWEERGPIFDSVGPSNGNTRGVPSAPSPAPRQLPQTFTSGRIRAVIVDAADPTGNTVWSGGVAGGLWKTTNFLNAVPDWQPVNDFFDNLAVTSLAQDPSNSDIMYFCTGEATSNSDAVFGKGVWKTTNHGATWTQLPATSTFNRNFKILVGANGVVYLATRAFGLRRSIDGGNTWEDITPSGLTGSSVTFCTDIEFTGNRLIASFGYTTSSAGGTIQVRYTDEPATVSNGAGWQTPTGLPTAANRIEFASRGDTVYAAPTNNANELTTTYRSFDKGTTFTRNNTVNYANGILNGQGWYNLAFEISPLNGYEFLVGGLDAYRSVDSGKTVVRNTAWVSQPPYVHADHHTYIWQVIGGQIRVIMATDGGLFLSVDNGVTYQDRNVNFGIKQFYSGAIHPLRQNYFLAGAQDNGSHQIDRPGKTYSVEVTGGDGAFVDIDQKNPNFQFTSFIYNQYRRSTNDGQTFSGFNLSNDRGFFINPFEYDDSLKIMYASFANASAPNRSMLRWNNPTTATSTATSSRDTIVINKLARGSTSSNASAFLVSPYTPNRLYVGGSNGSLVRIDNANTVTTATIDDNTTVLTGPSFSNGYINCIAVGNTEDKLLAVFSNYGVTNLWYSGNGGGSWTGIDGNLPDMPVRWALFNPLDDNKLIIATETGVWTTEFISGSTTQWTASPGFPLVRTDMLKLRKSDYLILAATHGRGLWTTNISSALPIKDIVLSGTLQTDGHALLNWRTVDETPATTYRLQFSSDGVSFADIAQLPSTTKTFRHPLTVPVGYYRIHASERGVPGIYSNVVRIRNSNGGGLQVKIAPNPISSASTFTVSNSVSGEYNWTVIDAQGRIVQQGRGNVTAGGSSTIPLRTNGLSPGTYRLRVVQGPSANIQSFIKQ